MSASDPIVKVKRDVTISFADNGSETLELVLENADLTVDFPQETIISVLDRGRFTDPPQLRYGDDQPITFSVSGALQAVDGSTAATPLSLGVNDGYVDSNWVSTLGASAEVFTVDVTITIEGTDHGDAADHQIILNYARVTGSLSDGDPMTYSLSGECHQVRPGTFTSS